MEAFHPLERFTGRAEAIAAFRALIQPGSKRWAMMVDGLSGTGKTLLVDWLRRHELKGVPHAYLKLSQGMSEVDSIDALVGQLDPKLAAAYAKRRKAMEDRNDMSALNLRYEKSSVIKASSMGRIQNPSQIDNLHIDIAGYEDAVRLEKLSRRFDLLMESLAPLKDRVWALFLDETEHLQNPQLHQFFLERLAIRLHGRFPQFRLYLTGQQVPAEALPVHETRRLSLDVFTDEEVLALCREVGIDDRALQRAILKLTGGHPLLVGMCLERDEWGEAEADTAERLAREADQANRTSWIYDRIIARLQHQDTRDIAANLSLFLWFDLSLLRDVFERDIAEPAFQELVQRSFVKSVGDGRWQCHDILRLQLAPQRRRLDPIKTARLYKRAFQHCRDRMQMEEELAGERWFRGRIDLATAALHAALHFSAKESERFCLDEMAPAAALLQEEFLFSLIRFIESRETPPAIEDLSQRMKRFLELFNLKKATPALGAFLDMISDALTEREEIDLAIIMLGAATIIHQRVGAHDKAAAAARRAVRLKDNAETRMSLIKALAEGGEADAARRLLEETREAYGDSPDLRLTGVEAALAAGQEEEAMALLTETILAFPEDCDDARLRAAGLLYEQGDKEGARQHVAAVLERDPDNHRALLMDSSLLIESGRIDQVLPKIKQMSLSLGELGLEDRFQLAQNPELLRRAVEALLADEAQAELVPTLTAMDALSIRGQSAKAAALLEMAEKKWPETRAACLGKLALAHVSAGEFEAAVRVGEEAAKLPSAPLDLPISLSLAYEHLGQLARAREVLEKIVDIHPFKDAAQARIAQLSVQAGEENKALQRLQALEREGALGPQAMSVLADLYLRRKDPQNALALYEKLVFLADSEEMLPHQSIQIRGRYGALLAAMGNGEETLRVARKLIDYFPDWDEAYLQAGQLYALLGQFDEMTALYRAIPEERARRKAQIVALMAQARIARGIDPKALLDELRQDPERVDIAMTLDLYFTARGEVEKGVAIFQEAERISPGILKKSEELRMATLENINPSQLQEIKRVIARQPDNVLMKQALLRCLIADGQLTEALARYREFSRQHPNIINDLLIAFYLISAEYFDAAGPFVDKLLEHGALSTLAFHVIHTYFENRGEPEKQIAFHLKAADQYPESRSAQFEAAADLRLRLGQPEQALKTLNRLDPEETTAGVLLSKARAEKALDRRKAARQSLQAALEMPELEPSLRAIILGDAGDMLREEDDLAAAERRYREGLAADPKRATLHHRLAAVLADQAKWGEAYRTLRQLVAREPGQLARAEEAMRRCRERMDEEAPSVQAASEHALPPDGGPSANRPPAPSRKGD